MLVLPDANCTPSIRHEIGSFAESRSTCTSNLYQVLAVSVDVCASIDVPTSRQRTVPLVVIDNDKSFALVPTVKK